MRYVWLALVALLSLTEVKCGYGPRPRPRPRPNPGCPKIGPGEVGICVERCGLLQPCPSGQICCFNGCGHTCFNPKPDPPKIIKNTCEDKKCKPDEACILVEVTCVREPCFPDPQCIANPCRLTRCSKGLRCITVPIFCKIGQDCSSLSITRPACVADPCFRKKCKYGPCEAIPVPCKVLPCRAAFKAKCPKRPPTPPPPPPVVNTCTDTSCKSGEVCFLQQVICITTPCDPIRQCVPNPCRTVRCRSGTRCLSVPTFCAAGQTDCRPKAACVDDPCAGETCKYGSCTAVPVPCKVFPCKAAFRAKCPPKPLVNTCRTKNKKCSSVEVCALEIIRCKKFRCPPKPTCVKNDCIRILCRAGQVCVPRLVGPCVGLGCGVTATCVDNPCDNFKCPKGQRCEPVPVVCVKKPCNFEPSPTCVPIPKPKPKPRPGPKYW